jgi:hypothetical protein
MDDLLEGLPDSLDLTSASHLGRTQGLAERILDRSRQREALEALERRWAASMSHFPSWPRSR